MLDRRRSSFMSSVLLHVGLLILFSTVFSAPPVRRWASGTVQLLLPVEVRLTAPSLSAGGGGSGSRDPIAVSRGRPPRYDMMQIAPPTAAPRSRVRLAVRPTLIGPANQIAPTHLAVFGDPLARVGPPSSSGPGGQGGIGTKGRGGVGLGDGPGPGGGSGCCSGVYHVGGGVSPPRLLRRVEPEYSAEARKAKWQGTVVLAVEVWPDGRAHDVRVVQALGMGLDERAVAAVEQWIFEPGRKDGQPVKVQSPSRGQLSFAVGSGGSKKRSTHYQSADPQGTTGQSLVPLRTARIACSRTSASHPDRTRPRHLPVRLLHANVVVGLAGRRVVVDE